MKSFNQLWVTLLVLSGGLFLWLFGIASHQFWQYNRLTAQAQIQGIEWSLKEFNPAHYALEAKYVYVVGNKEYEGRSILKSPTFPNRFAAENYMKSSIKKRSFTWYQKSDPTYSCLEKVFPKKSFTHALLSFGVLIYFYFARNLILKFL